VYLRSIRTKDFGGSLLEKRLLRGSSRAFGERLGGAVVGLVTGSFFAAPHGVRQRTLAMRFVEERGSDEGRS
jgi:hypothetical protein